MTKLRILILVLSILCIYKQVQCDITKPVCDEGWHDYGKKCYMINNKKSVTRATSQEECQYFDSNLLDIQSKEELRAVLTMIKPLPSSGYWTDLNDLPSNSLHTSGSGVWKWGRYQPSDMSIITWNSSPRNDGISNCAGLNIQGSLEDLNCNSKQRYICKAESNEGCLLGWLVSKSSCYFVSDDLKTWEQARTYCESLATPSLNSKLFVISKQEDVDFIKNQKPYLDRTTNIFWTGLRFIAGGWSWYTQDYFDSSLLHWKVEPDNVAGEEHCGLLLTTGVFSDRNCSSNSNFICDKPQYTYNQSLDVGCGSWIRAGRYCYGFITGKYNAWADARQYCQSMGADLLKVDSIAQKSWLEVQLMNPPNVRLFWTGLNDMHSEAIYVWADGVPANQTYIKWNQEPNNYKGSENCAVIYSTGQYNDLPCFTQAAAICEIDGLVQDPCDHGWMRSGKNCYYFTPYNQSSKLYSQQEANTYCRSVGGRLLSVDDENEKNFINNVIKNQLLDNFYGWWTSLNDRKHEGFWTFDNLTPYDTSLVDWSGEPSITTGDNCAMISYAGHYYMRNCNSKTNFICQKSATGSSKGRSPSDGDTSNNSGSNSSH